MPLPKPHKDETQDDFMGRCMHEAFGSDAPSDRTQEQAVAMCMQAWRDKDKAVKVSADEIETPEPEDDEGFEEFMDRCIDDVSSDDDYSNLDEETIQDACMSAWHESGKESSHKPERFKHPKGVTHFRTHAEETQGMEFVLSDETPDRMGDIITATGWDLENFTKNPISLFNHNANFPIGRWHNLRVEGTALRGHLIMAPKGTSDRIDEIRKLIDAGILKAVSVGFRDIESEPLDKKNIFGGIRFIKQELVETSLVSVPANPNALAVVKSLGISPATIDLVFAKHGNKDNVRRRRFVGKLAKSYSENKRRGVMTALSERIAAVQALLNESKDKLTEHWGNADNTNVSDADMQIATDLNTTIAQLEKQHAALIESERLLGQTANNGGGTAQVRGGRAMTVFTPSQPGQKEVAGPAVILSLKKELHPLDYLVRAGTVAHFAKQWNKTVEETRLKIYGEDDATRASCELVLRAASAPAITTVTGWAAELVQQTYAELMPLLMPKAILTRLAAKGLALSFGTAGRIIIPTRSRTPTLAGSFVGEGLAIPVRQGAFTTQTLVPKKMAVISTWTREMGDHSVPAIEGLIREAIQDDTSVAIDTVLIDANPATNIRPAGLLNGVVATTATAGGGLAALIGDIKLLTQALVASTYGNLRSPVWMMNPGDVLSVSLASAVNTGIFPFRDEVRAGTLNTVPIIDSSTVPSKTMILVDAADFVVVGGEAPRMEMSDQATLHMEDTTPTELVASPSTVAAPQRSLFQTDSLALRMVLPLNWVQRRSGTVAWAQNVTWS